MILNTKYLKQDLPAGLVVFLVALPLCLGISLASGAPFFSGIISGIIGGIVIGSLSMSNLSVSGPAAGLAALVLSAITNIGAFDLFLCAVVIAGILQVLISVARLGGIANYFPSSVIKGLLTSIGILIIAKQIPHAFGYDKNEKGILSELSTEDWHELLLPFQHINMGALIICVVSIVIMVWWDKSSLKKKVKFLPGALVAVMVSIIINEIFKMTDSGLYVDASHLVQIKAAENASEFFSFFTLPDFNGFLNSKVIITGIMIAIIASLETLLCIEAIDNLDPERRVTNTNRELFAQGLGNTFSGLIGGLPITSVIVRSSANLHAGAKTKLATIFHGVLLLVCVITIPGLLNYIPLAALAAILLLTGYKLCKLDIFAQMIKNGKYQYIPFFVTVIVIISIDLFGVYLPLKGEGLLIGVIAGLLAASGAILHGNLRNSYFFHKDQHHEGDIIKIRLSEEVSFLNKAAIRETLDNIPENATVLIDASNTLYIDFDVLELIKEFQFIKAPLKKINCQLIGFRGKIRDRKPFTRTICTLTKKIIMEKSYRKLIQGNKIFAETRVFQDPEFFKKLSQGQTPNYLWIGCSDSRVPANEITNTKSGEIFVHRNVANIVVHTDTNLLSVLEYAVRYLKVKHIIVCGHYGCGGILASMTNKYHGYVDNWLRNIKDVYHKNYIELEGIKDETKRADRLTELNVIEQVRNLAKTTIVQQAWAERELHLHGWVYGLHNGLVNDLSVIHNSSEDIDPIYRYDIKQTKKKNI